MALNTTIVFFTGFDTELYPLKEKHDALHLFNKIKFDFASVVDISVGSTVSINNELWEILSIDIRLKEIYKEIEEDNEIFIRVQVEKTYS